MNERPYRRESYEPASWRFLDTGRQAGPANMAVDEAILEAVAAGESRPTLRLYGWQPACLSLGYGQSWDVADFDACAERGWHVVRRPTGGRAILHVDELTYSVCAPMDEPRVRGGVLESYQRLSEALLAGLRLLGLEPARAKPYYQDQGEPGPACFDGPSHYEITVGQSKLVGSAQVRKHGVVLQHGTLPLYGDITRVVQALFFDAPGQRLAAQARLNYRATTLAASLGRRVEYEQAAEAMRQGFAQALTLELKEQGLSESEQARAGALRAEKYGHESWTRRL
jgi:lipoate-protein ligase A